MDGRISNFQQIGSMRRYTLADGTAQGLEVLDCDNGKIRFLLNVSKACDIMQLYHKGQNVSFVSKNGFTKREIPFLNRFEGGMIYTCGLDNVGGREGYELHGTFHNTPAQILRAACDEQGIMVEAVIRNSALFGQNLVMKRKIFTAIGSDNVTLEDTLVNEGHLAAEYCLLYHINVGYPMLDAGARLEGDFVKCTPRTPWSEENVVAHKEMVQPTANEEEMCYYLELAQPEISLVNDQLGKKFTVSYSRDTLPHFVEWKSMVSGDYALGLEPATTQLDETFARKTLGAGKSVAFRIQIAVTEI